MKAMDRLIPRLRRTALALAGVFLCSAVVVAQEQTGKVLVDDVIPEGTHQVPKQKIISLIRTRPGTEYKQETIDEDVRNLYETKLFANIQVYKQPTPDGKVKVYIIVAEYPSIVQEIIYKGTKHLKPDELEAITGLHRGMPLNPIQNKIARQAILRRYNEMGRLFAGVELLEGDKPGDARVVFNITEGAVVHVSSIKIVGNTFVSVARLKTQIESSAKFLGVFGGTFEPGTADRDVGHLEEYYRSFGFQDVHVARELQLNPDLCSVTLIFHIHEGMRYRVASVQVDGNKLYTGDQLLKYSKIKKGDFYNKGQADADQKVIQTVYGYGGYGVSVRESDYTAAPGQIAVHYEVQERPPARVGQVILTGNTVTRDNVIRRQVPLEPGQILTYPELKTAEANLARLSIFESDPSKGGRPTVQVLEPESDSPFKDILVNVQEMPTGSLIFGVGVNSDAGLTGTVALNERNFDITRFPTSFDDLLSGRAFRGAGQEFRIEAMPGTQVQRYTVTFREPYLFDSQYGLTVSGYYWDRFYNEYMESRLGGRVGLSRRIGQYWSVSGTMRLEDVGVHNIAFDEPFDIARDEGQHFLAGARGSVVYDTTDSPLRPTRGERLEFSYEQFFGDYTFPQFNVEADKFWTLHERPDNSGKHVLVARSELTIDGSHAPVFERLYAGGYHSMRGFEFRGVGPGEAGFMVGGDFQFLSSLEYQFPIVANDHLYGVLFVDSGAVERQIEIKDYRVAVGFGLRVVVPMLGPVPIALDCGFPIIKGPSDHEQVFSFWVGFFH
jgi:outer membrane protein insertion porin family